MSISSISPVNILPPALSKPTPTRPFAEVRDQLQGATGLEIPKNLVALEAKVIKGTPVSSAELLAAQVQMHRLNLKVEIVSKGVEGLTSSIKRLQQQQ